MNEFFVGYCNNDLNNLSDGLWDLIAREISSENSHRFGVQKNLLTNKIVWLLENNITFSVGFSEWGDSIILYKIQIIIPNNNDAMFFKLKWG